MVVAFRRHTLLSLDDCLYALQPSIPHLARSSLPIPADPPTYSDSIRPFKPGDPPTFGALR